MKLYRTPKDILLQEDDQFFSLDKRNWDALINRSGLHAYLKGLKSSLNPLSEEKKELLKNILAPIGNQEVWASGVTYFRSREARMEEAEKAGGGSFYDRVYYADRPELFFKATASRTVGHGDTVNIRRDSTWDVPEPELTLFLNSEGSIEGYTIGNDMSSRSIEGENPLYLPQAKTYERCASLGPCLYVPSEPLSKDTEIHIKIIRGTDIMYQDSVPLTQMKRQPEELAGYLFRECNFPMGVYLMTGTGLVPPGEFTLQVGDEVEIEIGPIGSIKE